MSSKIKSRPLDPLSKKIPQNPKYKNVQSTLDTGYSMSRYLRKVEEIKQNYKFRSDEIFKRMKITTLIQLIIQVETINGQQIFDKADSPTSDSKSEFGEVNLPLDIGDDADTPDKVKDDICESQSVDKIDTSRSTLLSVASGVGELDNAAPKNNAASPADSNLPYLILDVRDYDDYNKLHIISAQNYPKAILSRSCNYETKDMLAYKNSEERIIVIYDEDERLASEVSTTLVQRGYTNIFMLSGGIKVASKLFATNFLTSTKQNNFTSEDIDSLEIQINNVLQDKSIGGRLSSNSTASSRLSSRSTARSTTSNSSAMTGRPAFR